MSKYDAFITARYTKIAISRHVLYIDDELCGDGVTRDATIFITTSAARLADDGLADDAQPTTFQGRPKVSYRTRQLITDGSFTPHGASTPDLRRFIA